MMKWRRMPQVLKKAHDPLFRLKDIKSASRNKGKKEFLGFDIVNARGKYHNVTSQCSVTGMKKEEGKKAIKELWVKS